jgi:tripartite-type tricarboxylate transporter receptor subunit TctC
MRRLFSLLLLHLGLVAALSPAGAQGQWPTKPVRIVVTAAPGGSVDNATRPYLDPLTKALGQQFIIENRGGASGAIGAEFVAKSPPDGYTFVAMSSSTSAILPSLRKLTYDSFKDLTPVSNFADATQLLTVNSTVPATTVAELVAYGKANPGKLNFGNVGLGTASHLFSEQFAKAAGFQITQVSYRGGSEALADFLAGVTHMFVDPNAMPHIKAGKVKLLAVMDRERHPDFPNVPTLQELYPECDAVWWFGLFAPAGTPEAIINRLSEAMAKAAQTPEVRQQLANVSLKPRSATPAETLALQRRDHDRFGKLARELNLRLD